MRNSLDRNLSRLTNSFRNGPPERSGFPDPGRANRRAEFTCIQHDGLPGSRFSVHLSSPNKTLH
jgi:hypothetical protein